jgi:hypothetical protein
LKRGVGGRNKNGKIKMINIKKNIKIIPLTDTKVTQNNSQDRQNNTRDRFATGLDANDVATKNYHHHTVVDEDGGNSPLVDGDVRVRSVRTVERWTVETSQVQPMA